MKDNDLPLPVVRCLSKAEAARYLGIGLTLLAELDIPHVKLGRRCVYDVLDLDAWLNDYKQRGRAGKDKTLWLKKQESIEDQILGTGGLMQPSQTVSAYAEALRPRTDSKPKRISPS
ncbi:MAG: helix-turn-helix domain-containing protein [Rugosibacter sp.]